MAEAIDINMLIEFDTISKVLNNFSEATGLRAVIVDLEGKPVLEADKSIKESLFCEAVKKSCRNEDKCFGTYMRAGKEAAKLGEPYISRCHAGLIIWAVPLVLEKEHLGSIICGQVLMWEPESFFWTEVKRMNKSAGDRVNELIEKGKELPIVSPEKVEAAAILLFVVANHIIKIASSLIEQNKLMAIQKTKFDLEIIKSKTYENALNKFDNRKNKFELKQKENNLLVCIRTGDLTGAYDNIDVIHNTMELYYQDSFPLYKARILDLLYLLSREAVADGVEHDKVSVLSYRFFNEINLTNSFSDVAQVMRKVVAFFINDLYKSNQVVNKRPIATALSFISKNYDQQLSLEEIANVAHLSPYYISHLFKKEIGYTVMDFVTRTRLEEAKRLIKHSQLSIAEVARSVGYKDAGHFSKIFKQREGVAPSSLRSNVLGK